jgi:hypothetical protein
MKYVLVVSFLTSILEASPSSFQAPMPPSQSGYNAPAEIKVGTMGDYDFFFTGSFIYWQPMQDNMNIGLIKESSSSATSIKNSFIEMQYDFLPGFKIAAGMNLQNDDWDGYVEYTRLHGSQKTTSKASSLSPMIFATWGQACNGLSTGSLPFESVSGHYSTHLDFVDLDIGRSCYVGQSLSVRPSMGVRGAWIMQKMHVQYTNPNLALASTTFNDNVYASSRSWGVGLRGSLALNWLVGQGCRIFGISEADLLYTSYVIRDKTVYTNTAPGPSAQIMTHDKVNGVRAHLDFEIGFGWGAYFNCNKQHFDLSASYGFQVFFDQNMFRHYTDDTLLAYNDNPNGNLYTQGLTATLRFDF